RRLRLPCLVQPVVSRAQFHLRQRTARVGLTLALCAAPGPDRADDREPPQPDDLGADARLRADSPRSSTRGIFRRLAGAAEQCFQREHIEVPMCRPLFFVVPGPPTASPWTEPGIQCRPRTG